MKSIKRFVKKQQVQQEEGARQALQEEWFNDYYQSRLKVYRMNFIRGIFFGFGSVIGGTVVIAITIWLVSLFVDFPLVGDLLKNLEQSLSQPN